MATKFTPELLKQAEKYLEYKNDPVKFAEECIMVPTPGGDELIKLYEPQKQVLRSFFEDHHLILLKSRQTGFSTLSQIIMTYMCTFYDNCVMGVLSRSGEESSDFCRKVQDFLDKLPPWLQHGYQRKAVQYMILDNGCQLYASAISPANPGAVFRGKAMSILIVDEAAHAMKIDDAWTGVAPVLSKAQLSAELNNVPFGTIILSTPNKTQGIGKWFFDMWKESKQGTTAFKPHVIHWKEIPDFVNNANWYKKQCQILKNNPRKIAQELELKFVGSENTLFSEEVQEKLQKVEGNKPLEIIKHIEGERGSELWRFKNLRREKFHMIGVDTASEGGGSDFSSIEVFEFESMDQVMEFKGKLAVKKFANVVKSIAKMVPNNIIIVENNSYGNQVVEELWLDDTFEYNLYGEYKGAAGTKGKSSGRTRSSGSSNDFIPGINTNAHSRPLILDALYNYVNENPNNILSERLAFELIALRDKAGKIEADSGSNDDLALAYGFICYVRHYCRDLIGDTDNVNVEDKIDHMDSTSMLSAFNNEGSPLRGYYKESESFNMFKKDLGKFLKNNVGGSVGGVVDVMQLWGRNDSLFNVKDD